MKNDPASFELGARRSDEHKHKKNPFYPKNGPKRLKAGDSCFAGWEQSFLEKIGMI